MAKTTRKPGATGTIKVTELVLKQPYRSNVDIASWRTAIQSAESIISPRRLLLYDLYEDLMLDGHLRSVIDKRRRAVRAMPISFLKDGEEVEAVSNFLNTSAFRQMLSDLNDHKFYGHTLVQCDFTDEKLKYDLIPRKHVMPEFGLVTINQGDTSGIDYRSNPESGYVIEAGGNRDLGLLVSAAQYVIWKRGCMGDWSELAELFGRPLRKGKYNPSDTAGKAALLQMLANLGGAPYIAYPDGTDVTVDAAGSNLTGDIYQLLKAACNDEISKLIIGSTLTTDAGNKGARALGEIHERGEQDVFNEDCMDIMSILNNDFFRLMELHGFPMAGGEFFYQDTEELSRKVQLDMVKTIKIDLSVPVSDDYIYETFDIPKPENYDQLKADQKAAVDALTASKAAVALAAGDQAPAVNEGLEPNAGQALAEEGKDGSVPSKPAKGKKKDTTPDKPSGRLRALLSGFFTTLRGKKNPIDAFADQAQSEAHRIAKMIYDDNLPDGFVVDEDLVQLIADSLVKAIEEGYGTIGDYEFGSNRRALGEKLIQNAYQFSAAKVQGFQHDMKALMLDGDGNPLSFSNFKKVVDSLNIQYNKNWMQTEWNTSTSSGIMADKWQKYADDADVMPYLEFITTGDDRVREEHAELNGVIRPVDDEFWDTYYPPLDWGCRCDVIQVTNPNAKPTDVSEMNLPAIDAQFANNSGKTGKVFNDENPTMKAASDSALSFGLNLSKQYIDDLDD